jgi:hypothetical protein
MLTRRTLLASAAIAPLAGCATPGTPPTPGPTLQQIIQQVIDTVQSWAATVCGIIPTAKSILDVIAGFGISVASIGSVGLQLVQQAICAAVPPPASARFRSIPLRGVSAAPGPIGPAPTPAGPVPVNGWRTR